MQEKVFISGNDAVALGVRLCQPKVISAYPITPQTTVVERLSEYIEDQSLKAEFLQVESEHSALSACMGASSIGARTFTATSSQGLLYMAECLFYTAGGRWPVVMMNANRSLALPWSIYGDQSDSLSQLNCGWIQMYVADAQEALDMVIQAYKVAENEKVLTPFMINLDGFVLTHTYELVSLPSQSQVDAFLPPYQTINKMDVDNPKNLAFSTTPADNLEFKYIQHQAMLNAREWIEKTDQEFGQMFGRTYGGMIETYQLADAEVALIALGSLTGTIKVVVDDFRQQGKKVGLIKIRAMRPFPDTEIRQCCRNLKAIGVIDKDISFGYEGTVYSNVNSALVNMANPPVSVNFIGGLGGKNISKKDITNMIELLLTGGKNLTQKRVHFIGMGVKHDD